MIETSYGFDSYNQTVQLQIAQTIRAGCGGQQIPKAMIKVLNRWDSQSKHIHLADGQCECLCNGQKRWSGLSPNVLIENRMAVYDASRRHDYQQFDGVCQTMQAHYGTGGGNVPIVVEELNGIRKEDHVGQDGAGNSRYDTQEGSDTPAQAITEEAKTVLAFKERAGKPGGQRTVDY